MVGCPVEQKQYIARTSYTSRYHSTVCTVIIAPKQCGLLVQNVDNDDAAYVSVSAPAWSGLAPPATLMAAMLVTSCWFGLLRFTCQTIHIMRVLSRARNYMYMHELMFSYTHRYGS